MASKTAENKGACHLILLVETVRPGGATQSAVCTGNAHDHPGSLEVALTRSRYGSERMIGLYIRPADCPRQLHAEIAGGHEKCRLPKPKTDGGTVELIAVFQWACIFSQ